MPISSCVFRLLRLEERTLASFRAPCSVFAHCTLGTAVQWTRITLGTYRGMDACMSTIRVLSFLLVSVSSKCVLHDLLSSYTARHYYRTQYGSSKWQNFVTMLFSTTTGALSYSALACSAVGSKKALSNLTRFTQ